MTHEQSPNTTVTEVKTCGLFQVSHPFKFRVYARVQFYSDSERARAFCRSSEVLKYYNISNRKLNSQLFKSVSCT